MTVGGKELTWKAHQTSDYFIDFLQSFGKERGEYVAGYAVAYVVADEEMKVTLALSTNDQGKAWLNGKEVFKFAETRDAREGHRPRGRDARKGQNVLVLKVINEVNNWQGCARFLKGGAPVTVFSTSATAMNDSHCVPALAIALTSTMPATGAPAALASTYGRSPRLVSSKRQPKRSP